MPSAIVKNRILDKAHAIRRAVSVKNDLAKPLRKSSDWGKGGWDKDWDKGWNKDGH